MRTGKKIFDYLEKEVSKEDSVSSSHWKKHHQDFQFTGSGFNGLSGFGGFGRSRGLVLSAFEHLLQSRYRKMGGVNYAYLEKLAYDITTKQNRAYDLDVLRQVLTISFLYDKAPYLLSREGIGCVIGDGFGSMTSLLLASKSAGSVILINLSKTLMVDLWYLKMWMGEHGFQKSVALVSDESELSQALQSSQMENNVKVIAIQAQNHHLLRYCEPDFTINIASMGEMNPDSIAAYFDNMRSSQHRKSTFLYCCNRVEKILPDGTVTRFAEYPWASEDKVIVDEYCPWTQDYYSFTPPFYRKYDGPFKHRLANLRLN
jgi:hypothetical protein